MGSRPIVALVAAAPLFMGLLVGSMTGCSSGTNADESDALADGGSDTEERRCLALSMYWEAKAEGRRGMRAVGHVVMNRVRDPRFPNTPCAVVEEGGEQRGCQFSWYCDGRSDVPREAENWRRARVLASELLAGEHRDITKGALFFHARRLKSPWRVEREKTVSIGQHVFYR